MKIEITELKKEITELKVAFEDFEAKKENKPPRKEISEETFKKEIRELKVAFDELKTLVCRVADLRIKESQINENLPPSDGSGSVVSRNAMPNRQVNTTRRSRRPRGQLRQQVNQLGAVVHQVSKNAITEIIIPGQEVLKMSVLTKLSASDQKQMLGEHLFRVIKQTHPELAGKITGMLLEIDNSELLHMLEYRDALAAKVEEAVSVLEAHKAREKLTSQP